MKCKNSDFHLRFVGLKRFILIYLVVTGFTVDPPPILNIWLHFYDTAQNPVLYLSTGAYKACNVKSLIISIFLSQFNLQGDEIFVSELKWENTAGHIITHKIITCWVIRWKISVHCTLFHYNIKLWSNASTWKSSVSFRTIKLVCFMKIYQCHISTHTKNHNKNAANFRTIKFFFSFFPYSKTLLKMFSPSGHPRCRWVCFFIRFGEM